MPYTEADYPNIIRALPPKARTIWVRAFNNAVEIQKLPEENAYKIAWSAVKNKYKKVEDKWQLKESEMENETYEIDNVEIFSTGKWNGDEYTEKDLDLMVEAFTKVNFTPSVKIGHDPKQLFAKGFPSLGKISDLKRVGSKLIAKLSKLPRTVAHLIKQKAYHSVSSEIFWNYEEGENKFSRVLKAVALLGADIPAVTNLKEIEALYDNIGNEYKRYILLVSDEESKEGIMEKETKISEETVLKKDYDDLNKICEDLKANLKAHQEKAKEFSAEALKIEQLKSELEKAKTEYEKTAHEVTALREHQRKERNDQWIKAHTTENNMCIMPYEKENVTFILDHLTSNGDCVKEFSLGEKKTTVSDAFKAFVVGRKKDISKEYATEDTSAKLNDPSLELVNKTKKYMQEHKNISILEAQRAVLDSDNDLKKRYARSSNIRQ